MEDNISERKKLRDIGVSLDECHTCQDGSCSAVAISKENGDEYNLYITKYRDPFEGTDKFNIDGRCSSNCDSDDSFLYSFGSEGEIANYLCDKFSSFKCF